MSDKTKERAAEEYGTPILAINENTNMQVRNDGGGLVLVQKWRTNDQCVVLSDDEARKLSITIQQAYDWRLTDYTSELQATLSEYKQKVEALEEENAELLSQLNDATFEIQTGVDIVEGLQAENERLKSAANRVIEFNMQEAYDRYGDRNKAKGWACVIVLTEALNQKQL